MAKELTDKQDKFIDEYLIDLNATQAAIRAGYSEKTARQIGQNLLTKVDIQESIQARMEERQKRTHITQDKVLNEIAAVAFANATDLVKVQDGIVCIKDTDTLEENVKKAIVGIKEGRNGIEINMANKVSALEMLGKHLGMFKEKIEISKSTSDVAEEIDKYIKEKMMINDKRS